MAESAEAGAAVPLERSIPTGAVPLESILCTEDLHRRPSRPPDYEKENRALLKFGERVSRFPEHHRSDARSDDPGNHAV